MCTYILPLITRVFEILLMNCCIDHKQTDVIPEIPIQLFSLAWILDWSLPCWGISLSLNGFREFIWFIHFWERVNGKKECFRQFKKRNKTKQKNHKRKKTNKTPPPFCERPLNREHNHPLTLWSKDAQFCKEVTFLTRTRSLLPLKNSSFHLLCRVRSDSKCLIYECSNLFTFLHWNI